MRLEDYFDFPAPDDIRIKGTRIGIESVLYEYIYRGQSPEEIAARFSSITLEQAYAAVLYYLHNREAMDRYLADWIEFGERARDEQTANPPAALVRLRERIREQKAARQELPV